jgi:SAM-dependent methyltransferase
LQLGSLHFLGSKRKNIVSVDGSPPKPVWDQLLDEDWKQKRKILDWKGLPYIHHHIAMLIGGNGRHNVHYWYDYLRDQYLLPYLERSPQKRPRGVSMLSLGCGDGSIERNLFNFKWPIRSIHCCETSEALLEACRRNLLDLPPDVIQRFTCFDMNKTRGSDLGQYDIVFFCHALHHCAEIEDMIEFLQRSLVTGGLLLGIDYFGPARLQVSLRTKVLLDDLFDLLPARLKVDLSDERARASESFLPPSFRSILLCDPSEASRSSDIRDLLFASFDVCDVKPMGGTLLRHILWNRAGNYQSESDMEILKLLCFIERELIASRALESDELLFVLRSHTT